MHITEALPLPARPDVEAYETLAEELAAAVNRGGAVAIHAWAKRWFGELARTSGEDRHDRLGERADSEARRFAAYWTGERTVKDVPSPRPTLAHARLILALVHGFASWTALVGHIEQARRRDSELARFEAAVDAVVSGDLDTLRRLLREHPGLAAARSSRAHGGTLLHYVSANGVEGYRQTTPPNVVAIARLLLDAGADVNAKAVCYGGGDTPLGLTATSMHPHTAGVMIPLLEALVAAGAEVNGRDGGYGIVRACLANGQPEAAHSLMEHGADVDLEEAAGMGRLDVVRRFVAPDATLLHDATARQLAEGLKYACGYGREEVVRYLLAAGVDPALHAEDGATGLHWAAYGGRAEVVEALLRHGPPVEVREATHGGTPLEWALFAWGGEGRDEAEWPAYYRIVAALVKAGAHADLAWLEANEARRRIGSRVAADPRMQAALRGEAGQG
jgi:ankyrin repeat protein